MDISSKQTSFWVSASQTTVIRLCLPFTVVIHQEPHAHNTFSSLFCRKETWLPCQLFVVICNRPKMNWTPGLMCAVQHKGLSKHLQDFFFRNKIIIPFNNHIFSIWSKHLFIYFSLSNVLKMELHLIISIRRNLLANAHCTIVVNWNRGGGNVFQSCSWSSQNECHLG